jgi:hypothetical protein
VEGNRREAALRDLLYDYTERGKQAPVDLVRASEALDVLLIDGGTREAQEDLANRIMGMRHVTGGVKAWGGAEAAMIIVDLVDRKHLSMADAAESLVGVSTIEARRRYRAYKAYKEAVHDGFGEARMFTLLGEAIRTKTLREWLAWSDSANRFENREALNLVYYLITKNAEGEEDEDAISNVQAMRNLRFVVDDAGALACLIRTRSLAAAQAVLRGRVSDQSASSTSLASLARAIAS